MSGVMQQLVSGQLTALTIIAWTLLTCVLAIGAGAVAGIILGGKDLGNSLAALMGAMYGPVAVVPGVLVGLVILVFV